MYFNLSRRTKGSRDKCEKPFQMAPISFSTALVSEPSSIQNVILRALMKRLRLYPPLYHQATHRCTSDHRCSPSQGPKPNRQQHCKSVLKQKATQTQLLMYFITTSWPKSGTFFFFFFFFSFATCAALCCLTSSVRLATYSSVC